MEQPLQPGGSSGETASFPSREPFFRALANLLGNPQKILLLWNWKAASLSILLRAPIFLAATVRGGLAAAVSALLTESLFCAVTAGFYGAFVQNLRDAEPEWLTGLFFIIVLPTIFQALEFALHRFHGTPHLRVAEIASAIVSAVSSLFNWYAMRRGTLLVGGEGGSFGSDLRRLPGLLLAFTINLPRRAMQRERKSRNFGEFRPRTSSFVAEAGKARRR